MANICMISSDSHALPSFHCSRLVHNPGFCDHLSVGPGARLSRQTALLINNANTQIFWRKHGLKIWKSASSEITNFTSVVESGMERLCISSLYWDKPFEGNRGLRLSAWFKRKLITGVTSSGLKGQMNSLGGLTDLERRIPAAGVENAAMETSYRPSVEPVDTQIPLEKDSASATSSAGVLCPSITTVGRSTNIAWHEFMVEKEERQKHLGQQGCVVWITGLSGSGKSTLACTLDHALLKRGNLSYVLDGDNVRHGLNNNLGFSADDRAENIRRIGEVAKLFVDAGFICIVSVISPYRKDRDACRQLLKAGEFIEVYMNFPLDLCEERDPKGLYKLARAGKIKGFTGVDDPYEAPLNCEVVMEPTDGKCPTPAEMAAQLVFYLEENCFLKAMV